MKKIRAFWRIEIYCFCPCCGEDIDLLNGCNKFLYTLDIGEHKTDRTKNITVQCPLCNDFFKVDLAF